MQRAAGGPEEPGAGSGPVPTVAAGRPDREPRPGPLPGPRQAHDEDAGAREAAAPSGAGSAARDGDADATAMPPSFPPGTGADERDGGGDPDAEATATDDRGAGRGLLSWLRETAIILVSALVLSWLVKTLLVQAFYIPSPSMSDTLVENDRILVSKLTPGPFDLHRGDIVVFSDPGGWLGGPDPDADPGFLREVMTWVGLLPADSDEHLVKRLIGLPGDRVASAGAGAPVTVNGVPLDEPYLAPGAQPSEIAFDQVVPDGSLWVMGDNRQQSSDSRYNLGSAGGGFVPVEDVVGVAFVTVWPLDRATVLRNPSGTFAEVPEP
ncbi:signal peptidase I [Cellulomonas endophytica]|uniref:signal peptidase I n=1 Tax=Cellulomonas endophytica TaxID=2494735 RepID=UPI003B84B55D